MLKETSSSCLKWMETDFLFTCLIEWMQLKRRHYIDLSLHICIMQFWSTQTTHRRPGLREALVSCFSSFLSLLCGYLGKSICFLRFRIVCKQTSVHEAEDRREAFDPAWWKTEIFPNDLYPIARRRKRIDDDANDDPAFHPGMFDFLMKGETI